MHSVVEAEIRQTQAPVFYTSPTPWAQPITRCVEVNGPKEKHIVEVVRVGRQAEESHVALETTDRGGPTMCEVHRPWLT